MLPKKLSAHEIEVNGAPFRGVYLNFMSTCFFALCRENILSYLDQPKFHEFANSKQENLIFLSLKEVVQEIFSEGTDFYKEMINQIYSEV